MKPLDIINIQEVIDAIRESEGAESLTQSFGVTQFFKANQVIDPQVFDQVINSARSKAGRVANILEHIQLTANNSAEAIFIFYMLVSFLSDYYSRR